VKSSPVWSLILGSEVLDMLLAQTYSNETKIIIEWTRTQVKEITPSNRNWTPWLYSAS
jgi:hypothetical protein